MSGHTTQHEKTVVITTHDDDKHSLTQVSIDGCQPKHATHAVIVGDLITTQPRKTTAHNNPKVAQANKVALNISRAPVSNNQAQRANQTAVLPKAVASTQWTTPSQQALQRLRTAILKGNWGNARKMRCVEVLMAILFDPTKADPPSAIHLRTFQHARRQLHKDTTRVEQFTNSLLAAQLPYTSIVGPAHGLICAACHLGILIDPMH
jgi:hypothetical protein